MIIYKPLNNVGDTIVEVLIATALVSSILGGAYATSNLSLRSTRQAEERVEALKYTEAQIEKLRVASTTPTAVACAGNDIFCIATPDFCLAANGNLISFGPPPAAAASDSLSVYPGACRYRTGGVSYSLWIHREDVPLNPSKFTVHARWPSYGTAVNDEVTLQYRLGK